MQQSSSVGANPEGAPWYTFHVKVGGGFADSMEQAEMTAPYISATPTHGATFGANHVSTIGCVTTIDLTVCSHVYSGSHHTLWW